MSNWLRASDITTPRTMDEANRAMDLIASKLADLDRDITRSVNPEMLESIRSSWVSRRAEVEYVMARLQAGEVPVTKKDESRTHFMHGRACATIAAFDELIAAGVELTPLARDLREHCTRNLPVGFREKWTAEVLPLIHERLGRTT